MEKKGADVCIVGGGTAGMAAAYALKDYNCKVILIEKQLTLGGTATNAWVETWIEGVVPSYLENILKIMKFSPEDIQKSFLPTKYACEGKGGKALNLSHEKLSSIYLQHMKESENIELLLGYTFQNACIGEKRIDKVCVVNVADPSDKIEIESRFFIDCSGDGILACYNGELDVDFYLGEDPYERFEESLAPQKYVCPSDRHKMLNEPSLFFQVDKIKDVTVDTKVVPSVVDEKYRINPSVDYLYNGYVGGHWVNPLTGMNISGWPVIELGEERVYQMAVASIAGYWNFICKEIPKRIETKKPLYGYSASTPSLQPNGLYAPMLGIREGRRVCCEYMLREIDLTRTISSTSLGRNIACGSHEIDFHVYGSLNFERIANFNQNKIRPSGIPYECLIPKRFDNTLIACRAYGASHIALAARRVNKDMAQLGWAAGNAIKMCLDDSLSNTRDVNVSTLQGDEYTGFKSAVQKLENTLDEKYKEKK